MPYVPSEDRPALDKVVNALAEDIVARLVSLNGDTDISTIYKQSFLEMGKIIIDLESGKTSAAKTPAEKLAVEIFDVAKKYNYNGAWLGELNYSITRLIQVVPHKMVEKGQWKEELRYWLYALTVGSLIQTESEFRKMPSQKAWVVDGIVGVMMDIKDEYKRRVNTAYEAVQIIKSGDAYTAPFHTTLQEVKDNAGNVVGWTEIMKDFRPPQQKKSKSKGE